MAVVSKKERRVRILGFLTIGALIALSVSYLIAPRFAEPAQIVQQSYSELDKKILVNEKAALLKNQEDSIDNILDDLDRTAEALPSPTVGDAELKVQIEEMLRQVGLSPNSLISFQTPSQSTSWVAVTNPNFAYDPGQVLAVAPESGATGVTMYQKPLALAIQGPEDRLVQVLRRLGDLPRAIAIDSFQIETPQNLASPTLFVEARIFLMPTLESSLIESDESDGTITEVETPFAEE